mmetsp:Transcript_17135/g.52054  ORF Transcript_17135/g.52054 Transcript_17135/m.52054 type:complete len:281 (-) Transcript_17135:21-863(-)
MADELRSAAVEAARLAECPDARRLNAQLRRVRRALEHADSAGITAARTALDGVPDGARARPWTQENRALLVSLVLHHYAPPALLRMPADLLTTLVLSCVDVPELGALCAVSRDIGLLAERDDAWAALERDHLVRALAGVLGSEKKPASVRAFLDCGGYATLIRAMPEPRADLGRVTAQSVVQTPLRPGTAHGAGNAAKVLLAALSNEDAATRTAVADGLVEAGGVERLVCSLAHFKDLSVRKNCAVALAKVMAARPESKDRVRELRGIEMITTLGDKLTK